MYQLVANQMMKCASHNEKCPIPSELVWKKHKCDVGVQHTRSQCPPTGFYVRSVTRRLCLCRLHPTASPLALALVVRMRTCVCLQDGTGRRCARHNGPNIAMTRKRKTRQKRQSRRREPDPKPKVGPIQEPRNDNFFLTAPTGVQRWSLAR